MWTECRAAQDDSNGTEACDLVRPWRRDEGTERELENFKTTRTNSAFSKMRFRNLKKNKKNRSAPHWTMNVSRWTIKGNIYFCKPPAVKSCPYGEITCGIEFNNPNYLRFECSCCVVHASQQWRCCRSLLVLKNNHRRVVSKNEKESGGLYQREAIAPPSVRTQQSKAYNICRLFFIWRNQLHFLHILLSANPAIRIFLCVCNTISKRAS
jgi:hypothetical protein